MGRPRRKGDKKRDKLVIEFDEKKRAEFLTGFKKRKDERRKKAKKEVEDTLKAERKRLKSKKESMVRAELKELESLSEVLSSSAAEQQTYELPQHWVTVTEISDVDYVGGTGTYLGTNDQEEPDDEEDENVNGAADSSAEKPASKTESADDTQTKRKRSAETGAGGKTKRKKRHVNFSHTHHKRPKMDAEQRLVVKRKQKRNQKRFPRKKPKTNTPN